MVDKKVDKTMMRKKSKVSFILTMLLLVGTLAIDISVAVVNLESESRDFKPKSGVDWWHMFHHDPYHTGHSTSKAPNTNHTLWSSTTDGTVYSSPAVANSGVYIGSWDDKIHCLDTSTGTNIWSYTTGQHVWSSPAVADGRVYIGSWDSKIHCFNASTGSKIWSYTTSNWIWSSPAVADGRVYIGSDDRKVYCLDASTGAFIWSYTTDNWVRSSPAVAGGKVYVGSHDNKVYCLDASTGTKIWSYTTDNWIWSSPAVSDGRVYIGSWDDKVYCLNAATGAFIWSYTTSGDVTSSPAVVGGKVYVGSTDNKVYCLDASTGTKIWSYATGHFVESSPAVADGKVYVGSYDYLIYCLDASTGAKIWSYTTGNQVYSSPAVADGKVYVGSHDKKVYAFGPQPYDVTIQAYCHTEGVPVSVSITMDESPTEYNTPHTFTGLTYTHTFTVPNADPNGHPFRQWSTGETGTAITVTTGGTYTAHYQAKHNLTITPSTGGTTNPTAGTYTYWDGTTVSVTAIADTNYAFDHWALDGSWDYSNPVNVTMDSDLTLHAVFTYIVTIEAYCYAESVDVSVSILMDGSPTGHTTPYTFTNLTGTHTFTVPNTDPNGHLFRQWSTGETGTAITVTTGGTYTAHYQAKHNLTITTSTGGITNPSPGTYIYWDGTISNVTAIADLGYLLDYWELNGANAENPNPISITMSTNYTVHAVFSWVGTCNLTITTITGGTMNLISGTHTYTNGTIVSVTAIPDVGYLLDCWELDSVNVGNSNPISVIMNTNHTLHAVFLWVGTRNLTITTTTGGTTNPAPGTHTYTANSSVEVTAIPGPCFLFDHWELDGIDASSANPLSVLMNSNHTLHAVFVASIHDIAVTNVTPSKTVVGRGYCTTVGMTVQNQGDFSETFNVTVYADKNITIIGDEIIIGNQTIFSLASGNSTTIIFIWETSGVTKGNYTMSAYAHPVSCETYVADNAQTDGTIQVVLPGDINADGKVDMKDIGLLAIHYGAEDGNPLYVANYDVNCDGKINMKDIGVCCLHYGEEDP